MRDVEAIETSHNGTTYRSRTEARWAVFLDALDLQSDYEPRRFDLSSGETYLPDFYLPDLGVWLEVKGGSDAIVTEEAARARLFAADDPTRIVWLAIGTPSRESPNILPLNEWPHQAAIEEILSTPENRYRFLEDRRDERIYWLQADFVAGGFRHSYEVGGPGQSSNHDRLPILTPRMTEAYREAHERRW